jgi:alkyl sulfatase BDS1-like metallo-beta-lactamase superfamily hydrolase
MATMEECRQALDELAAKIGAGEGRKPPSLDRSLACFLTDLDAGFRGRLVNGQLRDITEGHDPSAKITLSLTSDDLLALTSGNLHFANAWASGRIKVQANVFDLIKLRSLL